MVYFVPMIETYESIRNLVFIGNSVQDWMIAGAIFIGIIVVLMIFKSVLLVRVSKFASKTKVKFDDAVIQYLDKVGILFYAAVALYVAVQGLVIPQAAKIVVQAIFLIAIVSEAIKLLELIIRSIIQSKYFNGGKGESTVSAALSLLIKVVLWSTGLLLILSNLGINITSLVASLGIGGIAIAFALQNILGDIFSSFSIAFDKPFEEGDYIVVGEHKGNVKHIGLKTTRLQALQGEEIVISNTELTSARVQNFKKMEERRISFTIGVTYETPSEKIRRIPDIVQKIIEQCKGADFDRAHFAELADSSLNFEIVYYVKSSEYKDYMDTQQQINLALIEEFEKEGIDFAYPTQTLYVQKD